MMTARDWCKRLDIDLTPWQEWACDFLEMRGQRFLVDFGYENAESKAEALARDWLRH